MCYKIISQVPHVSVLRWPSSTRHHTVHAEGVIWKLLYSTDVEAVNMWPGSVKMCLHLNKKNCWSFHLFNLRFLYLLQSYSDLLSFLFGSLFLLNIHIQTQSPHGNTFWIIVTLIIAWSKQFSMVKHLDIWWSIKPRVHNPHITWLFQQDAIVKRIILTLKYNKSFGAKKLKGR